MNSNAIAHFASGAAPSPMLAHRDPSREARHWIVRLAEDLPLECRNPKLELIATIAARDAVRDACLVGELEPDEVADRVGIQFHFVDTRHLIVTIETLRLQSDDAHPWLVAASAALRTVHGDVAIEDVQGLPRIFWRLLLGF